MVIVSILYPNKPESRFDLDYYIGTHMPRSIALLSSHPKFIDVSVERGVAGGAPGAAPAFIAGCRYKFQSIEDFLAAFSPHAAELQGDIANYTDIEPVIQFNDVLIAA